MSFLQVPCLAKLKLLSLLLPEKFPGIDYNDYSVHHMGEAKALK